MLAIATKVMGDRMIIEFHLPHNLDEETKKRADELIGEIILDINSLHLATGGSGLHIEKALCYEVEQFPAPAVNLSRGGFIVFKMIQLSYDRGLSGSFHNLHYAFFARCLSVEHRMFNTIMNFLHVAF